MAEETGECPHCGKGVGFEVHEDDSVYMPDVLPRSSSAGALKKIHYSMRTKHCPLCQKLIIDLWPPIGGRRQIYPKRRIREPPAEVTNKEIRRDYTEADETAETSVRGAAALARRALQGALREQGFTHPSKKLYREIEVAEASPRLTAELVEKLQFLKDVGNDGAHPNYDYAGEIIDVQPNELEMLMETLGEFFDVFYVRPARHKKTMEERRARVGTPAAAEKPDKK
jgi:Domain of unknown function (DUF4145)